MAAKVTRAASRAENALNKKYSACLVSQTLTLIGDALADPQYFRLASLESYEGTRNLLYKIKAILDSKNIKLDADSINEVNQLIAKVDPYKPSADKSIMRIATIRYAPGAMKDVDVYDRRTKTYKKEKRYITEGFNGTDDVRDVSLLNDLIFDPEFQGRMNALSTSAEGKFETVQKRFKKNKLKLLPQYSDDEVKKNVYETTKIFVRTLSFPGSRSKDKDVTALRRSAKDKSQKFVAAAAAGDGSYQPKFTNDELWALDLDFKNRNNNDLAELQNGGLGPRYDTVTNRIKEQYEAIAQAGPLIQKRAAARVENGDIMMMGGAQFKRFFGKPTSSTDAEQLFITRTPYLHAALMLKPEGDDKGKYGQLLHMWKGNLMMQRASLPDGVNYDAHRIHPEKLMTEPLRIMLKKELPRGQDGDEAVEGLLRKKIASYESRYRTAMAMGFEDNEPLYRVGINQTRAVTSILPNLSFFRKKKDIYDQAARARAKAYSSGAGEKVSEELGKLDEKEAEYNQQTKEYEDEASKINAEMNQLIEQSVTANLKTDANNFLVAVTKLANLSSQMDIKLAELKDIRGLRVYLEGERAAIAQAEADRKGKPRKEVNSKGEEHYEDLEMCSQLVLNETARRLRFMEDQLKAEYDIRTSQRLFDLSDFDGLDPNRFTPGTLDRLLKKLIAKKAAEKVPPDTGLFAN